MRLEFGAALFLATFALAGRAHTAPTYTIEEAVAIAQRRTRKSRSRAKKCRERAAVSLKRARDTFRSLTSSGFYDKRQQQTETATPGRRLQCNVAARTESLYRRSSDQPGGHRTVEYRETES